MTRIFAISLLALAACGSNNTAARTKQCEEIRDRVLPVRLQVNADALKDLDDKPDIKAREQFMADGEIDAFKTKFVAYCVAHDDLDLPCMDALAKRTKECREKLKPMERAVYSPDDQKRSRAEWDKAHGGSGS